MITLTLQPTHTITTMGILTVTPMTTHTPRIMITPPTLMGTTTTTTENTMIVIAMTLIHLVIVLNHTLSWIGLESSGLGFKQSSSDIEPFK